MTSRARTQRFKQADVSRALKAASAAGMRVARVEIDVEGKIVLVALSDEPTEVTQLQQWRASRGKS